MPLPKQEKKENFFLVMMAIALPKMKKKKIEWNYGNVIAENGRKKKIVAKIWEEIFKKVLRSQYFYNTFTTNHR